MASNADYLAQVPLFSQLPRSSLADLAERAVRRTLEPAEVLFLEGEPGHALYVIVGGRVRIEGLGPKGEVQVLGMGGPGEVIGEMSLIDGLGRSARVVAHSKCRLLILHRAEFEQFILREPTASFAIMRALCGRVRAADRRLMDLRGLDIRGRLLEFLQAESDTDGVLRIGMTQAQLSEMLGCTREAVNKALARLESDGVLVRSSRAEWRIKAVPQ